jgi:hypothetical protein
LRAPPGTTAALDKAVAIEQRMDGTVGRNFDPRKSPNQTFTNLSSAQVVRSASSKIPQASGFGS